MREDHMPSPQADRQLCFSGAAVRCQVDQAPARFRTDLEGQAAKQQAAGDGRVGSGIKPTGALAASARGTLR